MHKSNIMPFKIHKSAFLVPPFPGLPREHQFITTINPTGYNQICLWGSFVQGGWKSRIYVGRGGLSMILWYKKALGLRSGFVGQPQSRVGEGATGSERDLQCFKLDWSSMVLQSSCTHQYSFTGTKSLKMPFYLRKITILMHTHNSSQNRSTFEESL